MGVLNPVVQPLVSPMVRLRSKGLDRPGVAAQFVRHHDPRLAKLHDQRTKETSGCLCVSARLNHDVEHISIPSNCPPQPVFCSRYDNHGFVEVPFGVWLWPVLANAVRKLPAEPVHPQADRLSADSYASFCKEILNIRRTQRKAMINPNRVGNNGPGKAEAF